MSCCRCHHDASNDHRRGFLAKAACLALGAVAYAVPALTGLVAFLNPWRQKSEGGQSIRVAAMAAVPVGGPPQRFSVIADRRDAWNTFPSEPIGAVFLHRPSEDKVLALSVVCPHAGCFVTYDSKSGNLSCPCHNALFDVDGKRTEAKSMSPRDLDALEVEVRNGVEIWVKFEKFQTGTSEKILKT